MRLACVKHEDKPEIHTLFKQTAATIHDALVFFVKYFKASEIFTTAIVTTATG